MSIETMATYTITAPAGVDGYGEVAVLNDTTSGNFVGYLSDLTFAREIRQSIDPVVEGHGGVFGSFYSGELPFTMEVDLDPGASYTIANGRADKLAAAFDAQAANGSIVWTETGRVATRILFRAQQSPRGPNSEGKVLLAGVSESALILANTLSGPVAPTSGHSNAGKAATYPIFRFTTAASGTVVLSRTSPSPTEALSLTIGGATGLAASTATVVDFGARTVYQSTTNRYSAVVWPSSVWWAMPPGNSTITASGATSVTVEWRSAWKP